MLTIKFLIIYRNVILGVIVGLISDLEWTIVTTEPLDPSILFHIRDIMPVNISSDRYLVHIRRLPVKSETNRNCIIYILLDNEVMDKF